MNSQITMDNVKAKIASLGIIVDADKWIDSLEGKLSSMLSSFSWTYFHEEDVLLINVPTGTVLPDGLSSIGDVVSYVDNNW